MILEHDLISNPKTKDILANLPFTSRIIDVGCGVRPLPILCREHVCIEPHYEYVEVLKQWKPTDRKVIIIQGKADKLAEQPRNDSTVLLIDVIEHMEFKVGLEILNLIEEFEHAVIFTPLGWYEQGSDNPDAWGYEGGYWQKHRSAWMPGYFTNWKVTEWEHWHPINKVGAILAIR